MAPWMLGKRVWAWAMNESELKTKLMAAMEVAMPGVVVIRHEDKYTSGIPDISVSWNRQTIWLEVKHVTPRKPFKSRSDQIVMCCKLARQGQCWYVIYHEKTDWIKKTLIVQPDDVKTWKRDDRLEFENLGIYNGVFGSFDHRFIARFVKEEFIENHRR